MAEPKIEFKPSMDPFSWDIDVDGSRIGSLQSHRKKPVRLVLLTGGDPLVEVPMRVLKIVVDRTPEITGLVNLYKRSDGAVLPNPAHHMTRSTYSGQ